MESKAFRLPKSVIPSNYVIELTPDLEKFSFEGTVAIDVDVLTAVSEVKINTKELDVHEFYAVNDGGTRHNGAVTLDHDTEIATISFAGKLGAGKWKLHSTFTGTLNDKLKGFYRSHLEGRKPARSTRHRHDSVRVDRRPPRFSLLRRTGTSRPPTTSSLNVPGKS